LTERERERKKERKKKKEKKEREKEKDRAREILYELKHTEMREVCLFFVSSVFLRCLLNECLGP